jgi:cytochrome c biogenesis protein CcmG/thiol:disulfide interchange protein DsbE
MKKILLSILLVVSVIANPVVQAGSQTGKPAPDFTLPLKSGSVTLSQQKGKVVYLDFWASWCIPCRKSFPWMNEMERKYSDKGLKIITVNLDTKEKAVEKFLKRYPAKFAVAYDPEGKTAAAYKVMGMPSSYLIDGNGKIIYSHIGFREKNKKNLENRIKAAISK